MNIQRNRNDLKEKGIWCTLAIKLLSNNIYFPAK